MEITNKDKKLLVYLLAISLIAGSYFFGARIFLDKQMELSDEISKLESQVSHYSSVYGNISDYEAKTVELEGEYQEMVSKFFSGLDQESTIVMIKNLEDETNTWINKLAFQETEVMIESSSNTEESSEDTETVEVAPSGNITGMKQDLSIDYSASYADFKKLLNQVKNNEQRLYISSLSASYSLESGSVTGSLILSQYAIDGEGIEKKAPDLSNIGTGVGNIFNYGSSASEPTFGTVENDNVDNSSIGNDDTQNPEEIEGVTDGTETEDKDSSSESVEDTEPKPAPSKPQSPGGVI